MAVVVLPTPPFWLTTARTLEGNELGVAASALGTGFWDGWMVIIGVGEGYRAAEMVAMRVGCAEVVEACGELVEC
jgi:hypothetical protein